MGSPPTGNSITDHAYFLGTSSSKQLFSLVLRLRNIEMQAGRTIYLVQHVSLGFR
jgi:hypothetical protein